MHIARSWPRGRTLLTLARLPNLPTVWSNCLAAWLLSGGGPVGRLLWACVGTSLLYWGGTFLNDYFDVDFDRQHRTDRPIPAGHISASLTGQLGAAGLAAGFLALVAGAHASLLATLLLIASIVVYDVVHKATELSPVLIAICRFLLYLVAGSTARDGVSGIAIWSAFAMAGYVGGLSCFARREAIRGPIRRWPIALLTLPVGLALISNAGEYLQIAAWLSVLLALWVLPCLRHALRDTNPRIGLTVSGLLAGIVLVDLLAVAGQSVGVALIFGALFLTALLTQRYIAAT